MKGLWTVEFQITFNTANAWAHHVLYLYHSTLGTIAGSHGEKTGTSASGCGQLILTVPLMAGNQIWMAADQTSTSAQVLYVGTTYRTFVTLRFVG